MSSRNKGTGKRSSQNQTSNGHEEKRLKNGHDQNGHSQNTSSSVQFKFSQILKNQEENLSSTWKKSGGSQKASSAEKKFTDFEFISEPFQCGVLKNIVENNDTGIFEELIKELEDVELSDKNNDLYKFKQSTKDLKHANSSHISALKNFLQSDVRQWLQNVTGIELNQEIDLFCAKYRYTDHLLCHDDELEGRRIAFIMYFVKDWSEKDGGTLDLFDRDANGDPKDVVKRLVPKNNSLAFFEVTEKSFHQVAEVLTKDKQRLSVGGWFHGKPYERPSKEDVETEIPLEPEDIDEDEFYSWINPMYLEPDIQAEISAKFEETSEISLPEFLNDDKYERVSEALKQISSWKKKGPANQRSFEIVDHEANDIIRDCIKFLRSDATFLMLSNITGLRLHPLAPEESDTEEQESEADEADQEEKEIENDTTELEETGNGNDKVVDKDAARASTSNGEGDNSVKVSDVKVAKPCGIDPKCKIEVRRWRQGSYTLLSDAKANNDKYFVDGRLFFNCQDWNIEQGGFTSYIAKDEDEELLTALPENNTLQLIYKDAQTLGFVKYVNDGINVLPNGEFHDISVAYFE